jgi:hypothetical protein
MMVGEQELRSQQVKQLLPKASDKSFLNYNARMVDTLGGVAFYLLLSNLEATDYILWKWGCDFLRNLYRRVEMNRIGVHYLLFMGNYTSTPLGVHRDAATFFHFPIEGTKYLRTWPASISSTHPGLIGLTKYDEYLNSSQLLKAGRGGAFYMPTSCWHIGESRDGEFVVSLALSMFTFDSLAVPLAQELLSAIAGSVRPVSDSAQWSETIPFNPDDIQASVDHLPLALSDAAAQVKARLTDDALVMLWMKLCTAYGFLNPPRLRPVQSVGSTDHVRLTPNYPLANRTLATGQTVIAAGGHLLTTEYSSAKALLQIIRDGEAHRVDEITGAGDSGTRRIIEHLFEAGALEIVSSEQYQAAP